ncbi:MAG: branched-chain amino acid ABC transporter permease [Chloroflexi bacterium]|nr:branched-chain amino acid ABC transporter permease [Chloroflexota bacterium]
MSDYLQLVFAGLTMGSIYALVALGYHVILAATRVINFAQGDQVVLGGLVALTLLTTLQMPIWVVLLGTVLVGIALGFCYERLVFRPTYKIGEVATIIATIGISLFLFHGQGIAWKREAQAFPSFTGQQNDVIDVLGAKLVVQSLWVFALVGITLILLYFFFQRTLYGKAIKASATNELAAQLVGINPNHMKAYSVALASGLAALAGVMIAPFTMAGGAIAMFIGIKGFAGAVVGGLDSPVGVVVGGLVVGLVEAFAAGLLASGYRDPVVFSLLLFMLLVRPSGLFGSAFKGRA